MSRRKKGHGCGTTVLVLLLLFILADEAAGWVYVKKYMPSDELSDKTKVFGIKSGQVALLLDNELQEEKGIYENGQVYLPVDWVNQHLNQHFYQDEGERLLVYTLPESTVYTGEGTRGEKGPLFEVTDQGMYLFLGLMVDYTDIRAQSFAISQIKRVFIDTIREPYDTAIIKKTRWVREKGGAESPILVGLSQGKSVDVLEPMEKWSRMRVGDGCIDYIENRKLEAGERVMPKSLFEAPVYTSISMNEKVRLGFRQVTRQGADSTLESYAGVTKDMNVIVPTWSNMISNDGTYSFLASKEYVEKAHDMGLKVWAIVENVSTEKSVKNLNTKTLMSPISARKKLIANLMQEAETYGFDGFSLDFESPKAGAGPHYVQFIRELSVSCRQKGLVLSVGNYVPSSYTAFYNRCEQGIVAGYVVMMGYDEHYAGEGAGTVSSTSYVKDGIRNTLKKVPKEKVINAVPSYARVWTVNNGKTTSKAYSIKDAQQWVRDDNVELTWGDSLGQCYGSAVNSSGEQLIWMKESEPMKLKINLIKKYDLAGVACWKLGFGAPEIWDIVSTVKQA